MKQFLIIVITLALIALHFCPVIMIHLHPEQGEWGILYLFCGIMDIAWMHFIGDRWKDL